MIVRAASSVEAPKLVAILVDAQQRSRYAGKVGIDEPFARKMMAHAIHRHGHSNEGGCFVQVAEIKGRIEAFVFGTLTRIYEVGDKLQARDVFLIGTKDCDARALPRLLEGYIAWADANPRVFDVILSWTDVLPTGERFHDVYLRKGFSKCGALYRRAREEHAMGIAA